jgi:hypothetical protein
VARPGRIAHWASGSPSQPFRPGCHDESRTVTVPDDDSARPTRLLGSVTNSESKTVSHGSTSAAELEDSVRTQVFSIASQSLRGPRYCWPTGTLHWQVNSRRVACGGLAPSVRRPDSVGFGPCGQTTMAFFLQRWHFCRHSLFR